MIVIRPFEAKDAPALANLMQEMAGSYGAVIDPALSVADDVVRQSGGIDIILAAEAHDLLGFATFNSLYPVAGLISFTYVRQVYVAYRGRRRGIAQHLMAAIAQIATSRGSTRLEWPTSVENTASRALYERLGAVGSDTIHYVLDGPALEKLAARASFMK
jgi:GNAT superfamily N-acetyltransferase